VQLHPPNVPRLDLLAEHLHGFRVFVHLGGCKLSPQCF
jgi:hypothetical protein